MSGVSCCCMCTGLCALKSSDVKDVCVPVCWWPRHWSLSKPWSLLVAWRWGDRGVKRLSSDYSSFSVFHRLSVQHHLSHCCFQTLRSFSPCLSCWTLDLALRHNGKFVFWHLHRLSPNVPSQLIVALQDCTSNWKLTFRTIRHALVFYSGDWGQSIWRTDEYTTFLTTENHLPLLSKTHYTFISNIFIVMLLLMSCFCFQRAVRGDRKLKCSSVSMTCQS